MHQYITALAAAFVVTFCAPAPALAGTTCAEDEGFVYRLVNPEVSMQELEDYFEQVNPDAEGRALWERLAMTATAHVLQLGRPLDKHEVNRITLAVRKACYQAKGV